MSRTVNATEARVHFGQLLRTIEDTGEPVTVERNGEPIAVSLAPAEYQRLQSGQRSDWWELVLESQRAFAPARERGELPDPAELINAEREKRDQQILGNMLRR